MRIFIFGDSIALGLFDSSGGWVQKLASTKHSTSLKELISGGDSWIEVYNLSISGDGAEGVADRLVDEVETRILDESDEQDIVMLAVGINDAILRDNRVLMDVYKFQEHYERAIKDAQGLGLQVICIGLTAVDETKTDPWFGSSTAKQWKNNRINLFEDAIKQSSERLNTAFVGLHDEFLTKLQKGEDLLADGLHPNSEGHEWISSKIMPHC